MALNERDEDEIANVEAGSKRSSSHKFVLELKSEYCKNKIEVENNVNKKANADFAFVMENYKSINDFLGKK